jgi:hypothetical protein
LAIFTTNSIENASKNEKKERGGSGLGLPLVDYVFGYF